VNLSDVRNEEPTAVSFDPNRPSAFGPVTFADAAVIQLVSNDPVDEDALVTDLHSATVTVSETQVKASDGPMDWSWLSQDIEAVVHGSDSAWTIFVVPEISDFGVRVPADRVEEFRGLLARLPGVEVRHQHRRALFSPSQITPVGEAVDLITEPVAISEPVVERVVEHDGSRPRLRGRRQQVSATEPSGTAPLTGIDARDISAWFGSHQVLDRVSLDMVAGEVTALIGPSGCGKSTFLRILNRMHEMIPAASMAGEVLLDGHDIYDANRKLTDARREIGMVFQKPNPFPAMSIYDNVLASFRLTGLKANQELKDETVESCLTKAGLWNEVRDRLRQPGGGLSGGQQQRLCIARALAIKPRVLLMDEPCSALDPTSTRRIEETIMQLVSEVTIVIVTHNMQQAVRVSNQCAFFLAEQGTPGVIVEHGPTSAMFGSPQDSRTNDYVNGRFG
jgi:phosphate transport system ATP-binding protein